MNPARLYAALRYYPYEGGEFFGVYSTIAKAKRSFEPSKTRSKWKRSGSRWSRTARSGEEEIIRVVAVDREQTQ